MVKKNKLTPAEWEIMEAIWEFGKGVSIREVLDNAFPNGEKAYTTIQTIMNILVKKKMLSSQKIGLVNFYTPIITKDEMISKEMNTFVSRVFNGSFPTLASYLINSNDITKDEIDEIKKLISEKEKELDGVES